MTDTTHDTPIDDPAIPQADLAVPVACNRTDDARRREEERLRLALQAGRLVTWEYDPQTNTILRSENSQDMLGVPRDDLVSAMARVHPDDRRLVDAAYRPGGALSVEAVRYDHPDGRRLWLSTRSVEMRGSDGRRSIVGVTFDITERKEAEERA